jgi:hypothetical protein
MSRNRNPRSGWLAAGFTPRETDLLVEAGIKMKQRDKRDLKAMCEWFRTPQPGMERHVMGLPREAMRAVKVLGVGPVEGGTTTISIAEDN